MLQIAPRRASIALLLTIAFLLAVICSYALWQDARTSRTMAEICLPIFDQTTTCYRPAYALPTQQITAVAVNPDGTKMVLGLGEEVQIWDLERLEVQQTLSGHHNRVAALEISPNGQILASANLEGSVQLWDLPTGQLRATLLTDRVTCLAFSPNSQTLAMGSRLLHWPDGLSSRLGIQLWDVAEQRQVATIGKDLNQAIAFSPDARLLAGGLTHAKIWDLKTPSVLHTLNSGELVTAHFSQDGQTLLTGSSKTKQWRVDTGQLLQSLSFSATDLAFTPDEKVLAAPLGGTVYFWQLEPRQLLGTLRASWYSSVFVRFGLQGHALITVGSDGLQIWKTTNLTLTPTPVSAN